MNPERWERVKRLYEEAQAHSPDARAPFLAQACAGDEALHRDVQTLLDQPIATDDLLPISHAPAPTGSLIGRRLGVYHLQALLGRGGMGDVYRARDTRLERDVAIKVLPTAFIAAPERLARFEREARMVAALNHPHIAAIYGVEESEGVRGLVLELVEGDTLAERLARASTSASPGLPLGEALEYARQIAHALEAAHAKGITHRDLKPANIKITPDGTIKLLDFGIAKMIAGQPPTHDSTRTSLAADATLDGAIVGTPGYMSPEQARGESVDNRADIFSFGAMLYELLAGRRAFDGSSTAVVISALLKDDPPPLQVSVELDGVVRRCLQKDPARRFPTMAAVREALEECSSAPTSSQPSIAVLPFENLSTDPDSEYFGDGLAEEIINLLAQSPGLKVIARSSSFAFKGKREDVRRIAEILDVTYVLEGSVRKVGDRIRVTAQLISARDGSHIWSDRYDRELADVFAVQDDVAQATAFALHRSLSGELALRRRPTRNLAAYEAFLRSRHYVLNKFDFTRGLAFLEEAVALDPEFALAHAYLGMHFLFMFTGQAMAAHDAVPLARRHAHRALALNPSQSEAHAVLGSIAAMYDFDWEEAGRRFDLAFKPGKPPQDVRVWRANSFLAHSGRGREAVEDMEQAVREDPLNWGSNWALAVSYRSVGRDADADRLYVRVMGDSGPWSAIPAVVLSGNHLARGQMQEALAFAETAYAKNASLPAAVGQLAGVLARTGNDGRATALLDRLRPGTAFGSPFGLALYYLAIDDRDQCADWLEKAIDQRDLWVSFLLNVGNIGGRMMWSSPRWPRLAQLMNVSPVRSLT